MKKKLWKQILTLTLAGSLVMGLLPTTSFADELDSEILEISAEEVLEEAKETTQKEDDAEVSGETDGEEEDNKDDYEVYLSDDVYVGYELEEEEWTEEAEKNFLAGLGEEIPVLTIDDVPEELQEEASNSGIATLSSVSIGTTGSYPATYFTTTDNQNNAGTGSADEDLDVTLRNTSAKHPIEADVYVEDIPTENAFLAVRTYDVDWTYGEYDMLFFNGYAIQPLTGLNNQWNTSYYEIPISYIKQGNNTISVEVDDLETPSKFYEDYEDLKQDTTDGLTGNSCWIVAVDWVQLICDGGSQEGIDEYSLEITSATNSSSTTYVTAAVVIDQTGSATTGYYTEYSITDASGNIVGSYQGSSAVTGNESVTISMPLSSTTGTYYIDGLLKKSTGEVVATAKTSFQFEKNTGVVFAAPSISTSVSTTATTNENVTITVKRTDDNTDSVVATVTCGDTIVLSGTQTTGTYTATTNGTYTFTVSYVSGTTDTSFDVSVKVANIDKTAPEISYTPAYLFELDSATNQPLSSGEIKSQLQAYLSATDNVGFADGVADITVELTSGTSFTASVTDLAGNTTTKDCTYTTIYSPFSMTLEKPTDSSADGEYDFSASVVSSGGYDIVETGFVWNNRSGATVDWNLGKVSTTQASGTVASGDKFTGTSSGIQGGIMYYVRAYVELANGTVLYSDTQEFGTGLSAGSFSITNNGNSTFSITLTGAETFPQIVSYRTTNGSAVGGTHFTHTSGTLIFYTNETKTVTVSGENTTAAYGSQAQTAYTISGTGRTYGMEIYQSINGATLSNSSATRTMSAGSNTVATTMYDVTNTSTLITSERLIDSSAFATNSNGYTQMATFTIPTTTHGYLQYVYDGWLADVEFTARTTNSGYQYTKIAFGDSTSTAWGDAVDSTAGKLVLPIVNNDFYANRIQVGTTATSIRFPYIANSSLVTYSDYGVNQNKTYVRNTYGSSSTYGDGYGYDFYIPSEKSGTSLTVAFGAYSSYSWYVQNVKLNTSIYDETEPQPIGIAPMAPTTYSVGDNITVAVVFDEIVKSADSVAIKTNMTGNDTLAYAGGLNTNVLYFKGTVQTAATTLNVTSIVNNGNVKDYYEYSGGATTADVSTSTPSTFTGNSTSVTTGSSSASISITTPSNDGSTATATITGTGTSLIQYQWTTTADMPSSGWINTTDKTVTTSTQRSGTTAETWYLHAYGVGTSGSEYECTSVTFAAIATGGDGDDEYIAPGTPPTLETSVDNTNWAKTRNIGLTYSPSSSEITVTTPSNSVATTVTGNTYIATENGLYTFNLSHDDGTATAYVVVSNIDTTAPTVSINESNTSAIYNTLTLSANVADSQSGVGIVSYAFTTSVDTPSSWDTATGTNGLYSLTYTATQDTTTSIYLHVKATDKVSNVSGVVTSSAYSVVKAPDESGGSETTTMPAVTLTITDADIWATSKTLTWTVTSLGYGAGTLYYGVGEMESITTVNQTGNITVTANGTYEVSYEDAQGNEATAAVDVNYIDDTEPVISLEGVDNTIEWSAFDQVAQYASTNLTGYTSSGVTVTVSVDNEKLYSGTDITTNGTYTAKTSGKHTFTITDGAGNTFSQSMDVYSVKLDDAVTYVVEGKAFTKPSDPTKAGYTFVRWAESDSTTTDFDFTQNITKNTTIVSVWTLYSGSLVKTKKQFFFNEFSLIEERGTPSLLRNQ